MDTTPIEISLSMPDLGRRAPYCPAALRSAFERTGWSYVEPLEELPEGVTYGVVARRSDDGRAPVTTLVFGYEGAIEVQLADLWLVLEVLDAVHPDVAALCLGHGATIAPEAAETAAVLELPVFRIAE